MVKFDVHKTGIIFFFVNSMSGETLLFELTHIFDYKVNLVNLRFKKHRDAILPCF